MDGRALILCEGYFAQRNGKTAHGLVRYSKRYDIVGIVDSTQDGRFAHDIVEGAQPNIPVVDSIDRIDADWLVIGVATAGGSLPETFRPLIADWLGRGKSVASGLHRFLGDDPEFSALAKTYGGTIIDVRRPPESPRFFTGRISEVDSFIVAVLGTDACIGKRTTTILLHEACLAAGLTSAWIGTGQTSWLQGAQYALRLDALVNDFVAGEIEHAVLSAWEQERPQVIFVEGQGALTHPAYPGGFEILAAARPRAVVLQHALERTHYEDFPDHPVATPDAHAQIITLVSGAPVLAITTNAEKLDAAAEGEARRELEARMGLTTIDPVREGCGALVDLIRSRL